jgi:glycosyltransferase involved in cell wall biosynthesis
VIAKYNQKKATDDELASAVYTQMIWQRMFSHFTAGGTLPYRKIHSMRPVDYMAMYEHADIMLIPLEDTEWHACKSNLKILEAAAKRVPCIVSNVAPYNQDPDAPVLWVNSQKDWFSHLNYLILTPEARREMGNKLHEWAKEKYSIERINIGRSEAFRNLCAAPALL